MNWNSRSVRNKLAELSQFLDVHKIDVGVITETWLQHNVSCYVEGYSCVRLDRASVSSERGGGVAILVRRGITYTQLDSFQTKTIEAIGIRIQSGDISANIVAAYFPGGRTKQDTLYFKRDIQMLTRSNDPFFIIGDFNSRHRMWNCLKANQTGNILVQLSSSSNFYVHAPDSPTYIPRGRTKPSTLDLVLSNNLVNMTVPVSNCELSSDHLPVTFEIDLEAPYPLETRRFRCYERANWSSFQRNINAAIDLTSDSINNLDTTAKIDEAIRMLTETIMEAEQTAVPILERRADKIVLPESVKLLIRLRNTRRRQYMRSRDPLLGMIVESLNGRIRTECNNIRFKHFGSVIKDIGQGSVKFWKISKLLRNKVKYSPPLKVNNSLICSPAEKARVLGESFAKAHENHLPGDPATTDEVQQTITQIANWSAVNDDWSTFTKPSEVKDIIRRLKNKKAPGMDGLKNVLLKHIPRKGLVALTKIFNGCLKLQYFPEVWKHALVVAVAKPNKDITNPSNYRPISLLSTLSKIFERLILNRINRHLEISNVIPHEQFGFKVGHSTNHQLCRITQAIKNGFANGKSTGMVMLDVEKAYDSVWQDGVIYKLTKANFPQYLVKLLTSYLANRTFQVTVNGSRSAIHRIPFGLPQGSVLSPTLYNIFTADVIKVDGVIYAFFADDTCYLASDKDPVVIVQSLQAAQNKLEEFQEKWRIKINAAKTQAVFFTRRRALRHLPGSQVKVNNQEITWSNEAKYLGLTLDPKLKFDRHISNTLAKCSSLIKSLYSLINRRSRLQISNKILLFKCVFRSILTYGFPAWRNCAKSHRTRLQKMQNKLLKMMLNLDPWHPTEDVHQQAKVELLDTFIDRLFRNFLLNCSMSDNPLIAGLQCT